MKKAFLVLSALLTFGSIFLSVSAYADDNSPLPEIAPVDDPALPPLDAPAAE